MGQQDHIASSQFFTHLAGSGCCGLLPLDSSDGTNSGLCMLLHHTKLPLRSFQGDPKMLA